MKKLKAIKVPDWLLREVGSHVGDFTEHSVLLACIVLGVRQLNADPSLLPGMIKEIREPRKARTSPSVPPPGSTDEPSPVAPSKSSPLEDADAELLAREFGV